jgi:hypothetical protein
MPIIPPIQEIEAGGLQIQSQPEEISKILSQNNKKKRLGMGM